MKYPEAAKPDYYQRLHDESPAFQRNNWLLDEIDELRKYGGKSILELGCGNGLFLEMAARIWSDVLGVDWARSPVLDEILKRCPNVRFQQVDVRAWRPHGLFDLVVSADFLEHIHPDHLPWLIATIATFGRIHYHKIACYDDGHSHLSILPPERWLSLFIGAAPGLTWRVASQRVRKGDPEKIVPVLVGTS